MHDKSDAIELRLDLLQSNDFSVEKIDFTYYFV